MSIFPRVVKNFNDQKLKWNDFRPLNDFTPNKGLVKAGRLFYQIYLNIFFRVIKVKIMTIVFGVKFCRMLDLKIIKSQKRSHCLNCTISLNSFLLLLHK